MIKTIKDLIESNTVIDTQSRAQQAINQMDLFLEQAKLGDRLGVQLKYVFFYIENSWKIHIINLFIFYVCLICIFIIILLNYFLFLICFFFI